MFLNLWKYFKQKRTVKKINNALNIKLYNWQIDYIFNNGEYHDESRYGRCNGKTLANILKLLFSDGGDISFYVQEKAFDDWELYRFAQEDDFTYRRQRFFSEETLRVYKKLSTVKGLKIRKIKIV